MPSSDPNLAALPHPDLLLLLYHRLARMHGAWRIRSPTSHYTYSETELAEQLPVLPLIQAVHEVLAAVRVLAVHPETEALESSVVLYLHDAAVRVLAVTRSLDTENRVEWYRKALQLKLPTHRMVTLEGLVSGGKQGCVAEFGRGVAEAFLMGEEEVEESEEEEEEEYEE